MSNPSLIGLLRPAKATVAQPGGRAQVVEGVVWGRTIEGSPRYDLMLPGGQVVNDIPHNLITEKAA